MHMLDSRNPFAAAAAAAAAGPAHLLDSLLSLLVVLDGFITPHCLSLFMQCILVTVLCKAIYNSTRDSTRDSTLQ
jgi:hypothetical protein